MMPSSASFSSIAIHTSRYDVNKFSCIVYTQHGACHVQISGWTVSIPESIIQSPDVTGVPMSGGYVPVVFASSRTNNPEGYPGRPDTTNFRICLLYTSDAADEEDSVDLGGRR